MNRLYYGDNLAILREHIPNESVDLIYLDPPFNSNRSYNVLFRDESGGEAEAQLVAFEDSWHWGPSAEATYQELVTQAPANVAAMIGALRQFIGANQMMAYLVMMAVRLVELHRVLKPTGSLYLHCDPTASHYLRVILDAVFGGEKLLNEIIWKRTGAHSSSRKFGPVHDVILYYSKTSEYCWLPQFRPHSEEYLASKYRYKDADGRVYRLDNLTAAGIRHGSSGKTWKGINPTARGYHWKFTVEKLEDLNAAGRIYWPTKGSVPQYKRYLDEVHGTALQDIWDDIPPINSQAAERLGYPTQKPVALLERIIQASSNPGDLCLDPFCGCGTTIEAAQKLNRQWIGIDITHLAIALQKHRLKDAFGLEPGKDYAVVGEPPDIGGARELASEDRYKFQWWALSLVQARPLGGAPRGKEGKKGSDQGVDGLILFFDDATEKPKRALVQVKSGRVSSRDIRDLCGTVNREQAAIGVFITLEEPTDAMMREAVSAGFYRSPGWQRDYPKIQVVTVEQLLHGRKVDMPPVRGTFKEAPRIRTDGAEQTKLNL